jgi:hypothetical protein
MHKQYLDISRLIQINEKAFVYPGFLDKDFCDQLINSINKDSYVIKERDFIRFYEDSDVPFKIRYQILSLITGNLFCKDLTFVRTDINGWWETHKDVYSYYGDSVKKYGGVIYLNDDYIGGAIEYPEYHTSYKPSAGDLVLHTSDVLHGVSKVEGTERYAITFVLEIE